ncbi:cytochrome P450 [Mycolicibacterium thermoresistibile]|uniref:Steroid C26-monooxygenase n=2 Tax=Mycolicibacterium thermoresistibile TaxID=1797 RepID=G7CFL5_MYCT3|nr:cytochrome P450 [Mycolicibacterium thermoresistibile]EHI13294.1 cytochrome P450 [Mycolicibacterium thermoresistibile ATCC 19527]MCV7186894.1 cytochrome P450 [Mycolicibacterium thermoresistibile]GAT13065.1 cytochrome P450 [Mycolicibacterium thermoresistibile]SNW20481.1 cytochrome P450 [Mycolicibacterium thermoresistibile]
MTVEADPQILLMQMLDPANRSDPYPVYRRIRERGPVQPAGGNVTVFSSYADCDAVLRHPDSCSDGLKSTITRRQLAEGKDVRPLGPPGFLFLDPPDHTRLRGLVSKAFAPKVVRALEADIAAMVDELLAAAEPGGEPFDVISGLAYPLPVTVICRLLGVPIEDEPRFRDASALLAQGLDPFLTVTGQAADGHEQRVAAGQWLRGYLGELLEARRADPRDDLMSALIEVVESGDQLSTEEIIATCNLLLVAGHETTVNLIANAVLAMLRTPGQWAALAADPQRVSAVVEETLRYDPPVQLVARVAGADMTIGGVSVPEGDSMLLLLAAAHRDPAMYDRPDVFDPDRGPIRHLGFGRGIHFCLGAPLARLEAAIALQQITARFPRARLAGQPVYKPNLTLRGMQSLHITV